MMQGFEHLVSKAWRENILFSVMVELTYRCNLNCFYCYNDLGLSGRPLSREQYLRFFAELRDMQVMNLVLSGGEPLAHPDFFALGTKARELGFVVRIKSNGHALSGEVLRRLREEVDPFLVEVSLHGARATTHDRQTRVPGSFVRLVENLREMAAAGQRVKINCTLTRWNEDEIEAMYELSHDLGLPLHVDPIVTPRDDGDTSPLQIAPSRDGVARLLAIQKREAARALDDARPAAIQVGREGETITPAGGDAKYCGAGSSGVTVDPYGNVFPCVQWRRPIGNLHDTPIRELWEGSGELEALRTLNQDIKQRIDGLGEKGRYLSFCPGQAELETGSPFGIYASAEQRAEETLKLRDRQARRELLPVVR